MKKILFLVILVFSFVNVLAQDLEAKNGATVTGFRVCVYNGTAQNARTLANQAVSQVRSSVSSTIATKMVYQAPVFKVFVGACINRTEATILLQRLKTIFPTAFIVNDKIKVDEFLGTPSMIDNSVEDSEVQKEVL